MVMTRVKKVSDSALNDHKYQVLPGDLNDKGTLFGGRAMEVFDWVAGLVAMRHTESKCVTISNYIKFLDPSNVWEVLTFKASVNRVWKASLEVGVKAFAENLETREIRHVISGYSILAAVDIDRKPAQVQIGLEICTEEEKRRYMEADIRKNFWLSMRRR